MATLPLSSVVQSRLSELRNELALEPQQRPAWDLYAQTVTRLLDDITRSDETTMPTDATAPQRLARVADLASNRLTATEDVVDAGMALYKVLNDTQRLVADKRLAEVAMPMFGARPVGAPATRGDRAGVPRREEFEVQSEQTVGGRVSR